MTSVNFDLRSIDKVTTNFDELEIESDKLSIAEKIAQECFQAKDHELNFEGLKNHQAAPISDGAELSPQTEKTHAIGIRLLSWIANTRPCIWTTTTVFKSMRFWMLLGGTPSPYTRSQMDNKLNELTGSIHLAKAIHALSPAFAAWIQETLISMQLHESFNVFLQGEHNTFQTFVDVLLPAVYTNIAKNIRACQVGVEGPQPVTLADVTSFICEMVNRHLPHINSYLEAIEKTPEGEPRNKLVCHVFSPLANEFLTTVLPNGVAELPLIKVPYLSQHCWAVFQKQVLPLIFYEAYHQLAAPMRDIQTKKLQQKPCGEELVSLAQLAGEKAAELFPSILADATIEMQKDDVVVIQESPIVAAISKSFSSFLTGSELLKGWLSRWFTKELVGFGKSDHVALKQMWKFLGRYLEPLLLHIFVNMSQVKVPIETARGKQPDVMGIVSIRFLSVCSRFFRGNHQKIQERISKLKEEGKKYEEDSALVEIFAGLANDLLCSMGLNDRKTLPLPEFLKGVVIEQLKESVPIFLLKQYFSMAFAEGDNQMLHKQLRSFLFDPQKLQDPLVATHVISNLHEHQKGEINLFNDFYRLLWEKSGTEKIAQTLESISKLLASSLVTSSMHQLGISDQPYLKEDQNNFIKSFNAGLKSLIEKNLLEFLVHLLHIVEEREQPGLENHPKSLLIANALLQLNAILEKKLKGVSKKLAGIAERHPKGSEVYKNEATKLFADFTASLSDFCGVNPLKHLPLDGFPDGDSLKESLWTNMQKNLFPTVAHQMYAETMGWQAKLPESLEELEKSYHTSHPKWACKVLAQYSTDFIRHYLRNSSSEIAKILLDNLKVWAAEQGKEGAFVAKTLGDQQEDIEILFGKNLLIATENSDPQFAAVWPFITRYFEAILAKSFAAFSKTVREIEWENPDFTVDIAIQILKETAAHFSIVTRTTEELGADQAFRVPLADMLSAFGNELHEGIPTNPSDPETVKDLVRLKGCFKPLAAKLMKLANLTVEDFPIPSFFREPLGELIVSEILPTVIMHLYQKALEPQALNALMLNLLYTFHSALNQKDQPPKQKELEEARAQPNPKQKYLYETCGAVVLELIKMIPDTAVQYVFMKEKVKSMSAEAIGDAIMPYLSRWTLLQMIDTILYSGLTIFHPAKWEGKLGRETLVPRKAFVRPDGKMELKPVKNFKFDFPSTLTQLKKQEEEKIQNAAQVRKQLRDGFTKAISGQLHDKAWAYVQSLWAGLQEQLNDFIQRRFPDKGLEVKAVLDIIFRKIFFDLLGSVLNFITMPLVSLVKFSIEKTMIDRRSEDVIENLQSEVLENLFYKCTDVVIDALLRLQVKNRPA